MFKNEEDFSRYGCNKVFPFLGEFLEDRILNWDGSNLETFINDRCIEQFLEMEAWSDNYAFSSCNAHGTFGSFDIDDESEFTPEIKKYYVKKFINDCFMMVIQGNVCLKYYSQKELVRHFYNLWMAVNGGNDERS